ncbi:hypothetical protein B0H19DRAFT_695359 [Mycena capillaripes]|nr:hypothetical protein B0H19DRAFT_695359 [Mycena capillaripes]
MAHTLSRYFQGCSQYISALVRLVRYLFGVSVGVADAESGNLAALKVPAKKGDDMKDPVPTYEPTTTGVPALVLSSMVVGAAFAPGMPIASTTPRAFLIPMIVVTPPPVDDVGLILEHTDKQIKAPRNKDNNINSSAVRTPLQHMTNHPRRVHGCTPSKQRVVQKENIRAHPNAPCCLNPRLSPAHGAQAPIALAATSGITKEARTEPVKAAAPGSSKWEHEKALQLEQVRAWSEKIKARRFSLPLASSGSAPSNATPALARRASAPARLPLAERLRRAVTCFTPPALALAPAAPLWGDDNVSFVLGDEDEEEEILYEDALPVLVKLIDQSTPPHSPLASSTSLTASASFSSSGSLSSVLDAFEEDLESPV